MHGSNAAPRKDAFQLPEGLHYLNCAYQAPLPRPVEEAGIRGMRAKRDPSGIGPAAFFDDADALRRAFARLLGAGAPDGTGTEGGERVAILPSVSYGIATAARNAGLGPGQEVLLLRDQFPGNVYGWMRAAGDAGASVRFVDPPTPAPAPGRGAGWNVRLLEAIGPRTRVVSLGHVHWTDGTLFDLAAVGARCRAVGALLVVDGTQSVGARPFPLAEARPDAVIVAGYKWLLGPYSTALGWFGPAFDEGAPLEESWIAREGSRDFAGLVNYRDGYAPGAVRYDVGERSNFVLLPMLLAALELLEGWGGPAAVANHNRALLAPFLEWAREAGFGVDDPGAQGSHMVGVALPPGHDPDAVARALAARRTAVSVRGPALRISPHLYNDSGDLAALEAALREGLRDPVPPFRV
jgi:selenocysteine lyase/cysteine desulfurase